MTTGGRPRKGDVRGVRWSDAEWREVEEAAQRLGLTRSEFIRRVVGWEVDRILAPKQ